MTTTWELREWIDPEKLKFEFLCANPRAINIINNNKDKIDFKMLCYNTSDDIFGTLIELFENFDNNVDNILPNDNKFLFNLNKFVHIDNLANNNNDFAIELIINKYLDKLSIYGWISLIRNDNDKAVELIFQNMNKIQDFIYLLSANSNDKVVDYLIEHPEIINYKYLSSNKNDRALTILKQNFNKIYWSNLSRNNNDEALDLLITNQEKIYWNAISLNTNIRAIDLLQQNQDKINWNNFSQNPEIFELVGYVLK